jgi:predicted RNase H-like nuclease (RuvC/YqgF family)
MKNSDYNYDAHKLAKMNEIIDGFLNDVEETGSSAIGADSVQINKLKKEITRLKREVTKWKNSSKKLSTDNRKLKKEIKEYEDYYDRFDILDLGDDNDE